MIRLNPQEGPVGDTIFYNPVGITMRKSFSSAICAVSLIVLLFLFVNARRRLIKYIVLDKSLNYLKITVHDIQKHVVLVVVFETTNIILNYLGHQFFAILIDKSHDISVKREMIIVLCYVDIKECVTGYFIDIIHVKNTIRVIETIFSKHGLNISHLRGQSCDETNNIQNKVNVLKALIMKENILHIIFIYGKNYIQIILLFNVVYCLTNIVGDSCKRRDLLLEMQHSKLVETLNNDDISTSDTHYDSYNGYKVNLFKSFSYVFEVIIEESIILGHNIYISKIDDMFAIHGQLRHITQTINKLTFFAFDKHKLICFAQFYPFGFFMVKLVTFDNQLETFILDMQSCKKISKLKEINDHGQILVKTKKYVENEMFESTDNEKILQCFQHIKSRRE
ncbi:hypothetical protein SADUNF_Sadunf04G0152600 [Salix dunnii]|uniref:DUF4371 domain-containing protein n=1 Tax=Salix dunnii TaxID=1413687 RepID=A0A835KA47_9ROSI|nr:hypothetical protein SADUNF_Sadunf04G0152600 [Salix dunnii]